MMHIIGRSLRSGIVIALIVLSLPIVASAGTITMFLTDFDVTYLGSADNGTGAIYDAIALPGADGTFATANADQLQAASFKLDSTPKGTLVDTPGSSADDMWGDLRVDAAGSTLTRNQINFNRGNDVGNIGFDWFVKSGNTLGNFLRLKLTSVNVTLIDGTIPPPGSSEFTVSGTATVLSQNLPFGLAFDPGQLVQFSYSAPAPGITGVNPETTTGVLGSGAMTITGTQLVPEPASIALICTGGLMLGIGVLRQNSKRRAA
jgi:hypothetical protein